MLMSKQKKKETGVTDMEQQYWERFTQTGKVEDYLCYKGMEICQKILNRYGDEKRESGHFSDGDDSVSRASGRV